MHLFKERFVLRVAPSPSQQNLHHHQVIPTGGSRVTCRHRECGLVDRRPALGRVMDTLELQGSVAEQRVGRLAESRSTLGS